MNWYIMHMQEPVYSVIDSEHAEPLYHVLERPDVVAQEPESERRRVRENSFTSSGHFDTLPPPRNGFKLSPPTSDIEQEVIYAEIKK
jgi:hypothetical protein